MRLFDGTITTSGNVIGSTASEFAVAIEAGCNGVEAMLVLVASVWQALIMLDVLIVWVIWVRMSPAVVMPPPSAGLPA
ncbi:MAG TPA: hypothetical protein VI259_17825 [Gemmatimonadaceae bacterium]